MSVSIAVGDVAHGNTALIRDEDYSVLVDAAPGGTPEALLRYAGLHRVDEIVISHADTDHVGGLPSILRQFEVGRVWINGDPARTGKTWDAVRAAVRSAEGNTVVRAEVGAGTTLASPSGRLLLRVFAPAGSDLLWGSGSAPDGLRKFTANSLSAVVGVFVDGNMEVLLPGDAGLEALRQMRELSIDLRAPLLLFPHHGGTPGHGDVAAFAREFTAAVEPEAVVFSVGRARSGFPRQDVVEAVMAQSPSTHIACTQLNIECAAEVPAEQPKHLHVLPSSGVQSRTCCLGTLEVTWPNGGGSEQLPAFAEHREFVDSLPGLPMCRRSTKRSR